MNKINCKIFCRRILISAFLLLTLAVTTQADNRIDVTFNGTGFRLTDFTGSDFNQAKAVLVRPNGKSIVAGVAECADGVTLCFGVARYLLNGELDTNFNGKGFVRTLVFDGGGGTAVAVLPDASILVAGYAIYNQQSVFATVKYLSNGLPDTTFSDDGIQTATFGSTANSRAAAIAVQPDGKIIVAGEIAYNAPNDYDFALIRYNPDGSRDLTFDSDGRVTTDFGSGGSIASQDRLSSMVLQTDGKIVVAGQVNGGSGVARYNTDGSPDASFGTQGRLIYSEGVLNSIALHPDGKIIGGGYSLFSPIYSSSLIVRINTNGTFDNSFNGNGIKNFNPGGNSSVVNAAGVTVNGGIFVAGSNYFADEDVSRLTVIALRPDGQIEPYFGDYGVQTTIFNGNQRNQANGLFFQPDGRLIVAGYSGTDTVNSFVTARYISSGF